MDGFSGGAEVVTPPPPNICFYPSNTMFTPSKNGGGFEFQKSGMAFSCDFRVKSH